MNDLRELLDGFAAGRIPVERVAPRLAAAYYGSPPAEREPLRALIEVLERDAPGIVELVGRDGGPGFEVRSLRRPVSAEGEAELRRVAQTLLASTWGRRRTAVTPPHAARRPDAEPPPPGLVVRMWRALRRLFSARS